MPLLSFADAYDVAAPPNGIYLVRIWDIGVNVMDDPTWTGHVDFHSEGNGVFVGASIYPLPIHISIVGACTGDWLEYSDHFSAFYSSSTQLLTGGWFSQGNLFWGGIHFRWDGTRLTGKWTWYGRNGTGYEEWFPVGPDYVVPALPPQPPHDEEYDGSL